VQIELRQSAIKDINALDGSIKSRLIKAIKELENYPNVSNIKQLVDFEPAFRKRVGDYRILFDVMGDLIIVARILHRKEAY
jgi:mRNA interferase RelE/StbE